jgi:hypothetical protein
MNPEKNTAEDVLKYITFTSGPLMVPVDEFGQPVFTEDETEEDLGEATGEEFDPE